MLKTLLKKQLLELNAWFFQDKKSGKKRSTAGIAGVTLLYAFAIVCLCGLFVSMSLMLCAPLVSAGLDWLYFAILALVAVTLGVFGSVFNTYSTLYLARDNELLLSLPIPPSRILAVRLFGVWFWGTVYEAMVFLPAIVVYWAVAAPGFFAVIADLLVFFLLSLFILTLSCLLGWLLAAINRRLRSKSLVTVLVSLAFLGAYFFLYSRAYAMLESLIANAETVGGKIKGAAYPVYLLGRGAVGHAPSLLLLAAGILALFALTVWILARSFLKIATANSGTAKKEYRRTGEKRQSPFRALIVKERRRFLSSPTYMLNCSLGTLFLLLVGGFALVRGAWLREVLSALSFGNDGLIALIAAAAVCLTASMNDITAPSVSLEGKNIWVVQSLPVPAWQVLRAKLGLHLLLTEIPVLFCSVALAVALRPGLLGTLGLLLCPLLFVLCTAALGLLLNLKMPNLSWNSETAVVKQSLCVLFALFGGWILVAAFAGIYALLHALLSPGVFLLFASVLLTGGFLLLRHWLKTRGAEIFATL